MKYEYKHQEVIQHWRSLIGKLYWITYDKLYNKKFRLECDMARTEYRNVVGLYESFDEALDHASKFDDFLVGV